MAGLTTFPHGRLKHCCSAITDGTHFSPEVQEDGRPYVTVRDIEAGSVNVDGAARISDDDFLRLEREGCRPKIGDVLFSKDGTIGKVALCDRDDFVILSSLALLRPGKHLSARFLRHAVGSPEILSQVEAQMAGAALRRITLDKIVDLAIPVPALLDQQQRIANFLDEQTARIDALIAEKERLVAQLEIASYELLHAAVTKGLRQSAIVSSGRQWIGSIPSHWTAPFIRFVAKLESGHTPSRQHPEYWVNCDIPWFSLADVWQIRDGRLEVVSETAEMVSELGIKNSSARLLPAGTVMVSRTASVGFSAIMGVPMATTQDFVNWICGPRVIPEYLLYVFRVMRTEFERLKFGSTHSTIYMPDVAKFSMPLPPVAEQREIVAFARKRKQSMDALANLAQAEAIRLREYRSSLISAAVTGQLNIDDYKREAA